MGSRFSSLESSPGLTLLLSSPSVLALKSNAAQRHRSVVF